MEKTLAERSRDANEYASQKAGNSEEWNKLYQLALEEIGFELVPISEDTPLGENGPLWAPQPYPNGLNTYQYPCVIAPKGWKPNLNR